VRYFMLSCFLAALGALMSGCATSSQSSNPPIEPASPEPALGAEKPDVRLDFDADDAKKSALRRRHSPLWHTHKRGVPVKESAYERTRHSLKPKGHDGADDPEQVGVLIVVPHP
jgi:hypothetical protein